MLLLGFSMSVVPHTIHREVLPLQSSKFLKPLHDCVRARTSTVRRNHLSTGAPYIHFNSEAAQKRVEGQH